MIQVVCQDKKVVVAEAKTSCEQLLVAIVQDKRIADEQERQVGPANLSTSASAQHLALTAWPAANHICSKYTSSCHAFQKPFANQHPTA